MIKNSYQVKDIKMITENQEKLELLKGKKNLEKGMNQLDRLMFLYN